MSIVNPMTDSASMRNTKWACECGLLPGERRIRRWELSQGYDRAAEITVTYLVDEADLDRFTKGKDAK